MRGLKWCQYGVGTPAECDNLAEPGKRFCLVHRARNLIRNIIPNPPGVFILEELAARGLDVGCVKAELTHEFGGCTDGALLAYLDGSQSIAPICDVLARLFGTSESLWRNIAKQWDERVDISPSVRQTAGARNKGEGDRAAAGARGEDSGR